MKIWKTTAVGVAIALCASHASAANYYLAAANGEDSMFIAFDTLKSLSASRKRVWVIFTSTEGSPAYKMALEEYDCTEETDRNLSLIGYTDKGDVLFSGDQPGPVRHVVPSSMGANVLTAVCDLETVEKRFMFRADNPLELYKLIKELKSQPPLNRAWHPRQLSSRSSNPTAP